MGRYDSSVDGIIGFGMCRAYAGSSFTRNKARVPTWLPAGFPSEHREITTANLVKALTEHVGRDMQLRVARPHNEEVVLHIRALEAGDGGHGHH